MFIALVYEVFVLCQTDIVDINDIFRDLATLVHDQGDLAGETLIHISCNT